jgi:DNA invertase Pin-like site-specific DNA recombinase
VKVALYARVSTDRQDPEVQLLVLRSHAANRGWEIVEEFVDKGLSGAKERRPALGRLMKVAWAGRFQAVLVWRFDRFARSVKHLISALETFRNLNVGLNGISSGSESRRVWIEPKLAEYALEDRRPTRKQAR